MHSKPSSRDLQAAPLTQGEEKQTSKAETTEAWIGEREREREMRGVEKGKNKGERETERWERLKREGEIEKSKSEKPTKEKKKAWERETERIKERIRERERERENRERERSRKKTRWNPISRHSTPTKEKSRLDRWRQFWTKTFRDIKEERETNIFLKKYP